MQLKKSIISIFEFESTKKENLIKLNKIFDEISDIDHIKKNEDSSCICLTLNINHISFATAKKIVLALDEITENKDASIIFNLIEERDDEIESIFTFKLIKLWPEE